MTIIADSDPSRISELRAAVEEVLLGHKLE